MSEEVALVEEQKVGGDEITGLGYTTDMKSLDNIGTLLKVMEKVEKGNKVFTSTLGDLKAEGGYVSQNGADVFPIDARAKRELGSFLNIPVPYITRIGESLVEQNIGWHFTTMPNVEAEFTLSEGELVDVRTRDALSLREIEVVRTLNTTLDPATVIADISRGLNATIIDLINPEVTVHPALRVGDVTYGGLRLVLPHSNNAPSVGTYLHRLVCTNGMVHIRPGDAMNIKGLTHDDILHELANKVDEVYNNLPDLMLAYASLDGKKVADPERMVRVYALEHGISARFIDEAVAKVQEFAIIQPDHEWTLYDVVQLFTSLAHLDTVKGNTRNKLQALGGHLIAAAADERRCGSCQHLLEMSRN
jgi:hypothetical protein